MKNYNTTPELLALKRARRNLTKALELADGNAIDHYKNEIFQILYTAGEEIYIDSTAAEMLDLADQTIKANK